MRLIWFLSCYGAEAPDNQDAQSTAEEQPMMDMPAPVMAPGSGGAASEDWGGAELREKAEEEVRREAKEPSSSKKSAPSPEPLDGETDSDDREAAVETRSWFPETFVWAPSVLTDESGSATLAVTVPDTLTTWRVLGLAASRQGAQAGDVHTFTSTLPVYVDPRVPENLRRGDRVEVPVRVVNTTDAEVVSKLHVRGSGLEGSATGVVRVPAGGSIVETVSLRATQPGPASLEAGLEGADAIVKAVRVEPTGRPLSRSFSGVLGTEDYVEVLMPGGAEYAEASLTLFPGPLGVLRRELDGAGGGRLFDEAYAFTLGARGGELLAGLGAQPDADRLDALRTTRLRAQQRLVIASSFLGPVERATILHAADHGVDDAIAERLSSRSRQRLRTEQLGDGSWTTPSGTTLQEFLVRTAWICEAVDDPGTTVRCGAVFERNAQHLLDDKTADAYTAAMVLRSGAGSDDLRDQLTALVSASLTERGDGLPGVELPAGVLRPDGDLATQTDALAAAAVVLDDDEARVLSAAVIAAYAPGRGFGDGLTSLLALEALEKLGEAEVPEELEVRLLIDDEVVERHVLKKSALGETAVLRAPAPLSGEHRYAIEADGVWPGLAWHLDVDLFVPWDGEAGPEGLDIEVEHGELAFGKSTNVALIVAVPKGEAVVLRHAPPVGFVVDEESITGGTVISVDDGGVTVRVEAGHDGFVTVEYQGVPTLRGELSTGPATVALSSDPDLVKAVPPEVWSLR